MSDGDKQKQAKVLQAMSDLIEIAESELMLAQQVDQGEPTNLDQSQTSGAPRQADLKEYQKYKTQWQAFVQASYQRFVQGQQPVTWAQQLKVQALSKQATAEDWYDYANYLFAHQLCSKTDEEIIESLLKAIHLGYDPAVLRLLSIYAPKEACREMGSVFFRLFQLQVNEQSSFPNDARVYFLARSILLKHRPALKYLDKQIQADLKEGVSKSTSNQLWKSLRKRLNGLATEESEEKKAYLKQLNQRVKASYQTQVLNPVLDLVSDTNVMSSDDDSSDDELKEEAIYPKDCLPPLFSALPGSEDIHSDEYRNYMHRIAGMHVYIPAFVYRVGAQAAPDWYKQYGANAIEVRNLNDYLNRFKKSERAGIIKRFIEGKPGPGGWQLHRAFINAGQVRMGFYIQKYLASKHANGDSVTSQKDTQPLYLCAKQKKEFLRYIDFSSEMAGCRGYLDDAYILAKNTSDSHQVTSLAQYSALAMLSLAHKQGLVCPSAGQSDKDKPLNVSAWFSDNGRGNGVMYLKNSQCVIPYEFPGGVTTANDGPDDDALGLPMDISTPTKHWPGYDNADLRLKLNYSRKGLELLIRKRYGVVDCHGNNNPSVDPIRKANCDREVASLHLVPLVGGNNPNGAVQALCSRSLCCDKRLFLREEWNTGGEISMIRFRLSAYGPAWAEFVQASEGLPDGD